jgi:hypothetical protein
MEPILCVYCGDLFDPSPRHKNQIACQNPECQKAKKAEWQRHKLKTDPVYRESQKISQKQWVRANPGYWKTYRQSHPEKVQRNRALQNLRNKKARSLGSVRPLIAKMDASKSYSFEALGQFWLVPVIAKMDALKVNLIKIPACYP